jgi:hypothetical protein
MVQVDEPWAKRTQTLDRHDSAVATPQPIADPQLLLFPHDTSGSSDAATALHPWRGAGRPVCDVLCGAGGPMAPLGFVPDSVGTAEGRVGNGPWDEKAGSADRCRDSSRPVIRCGRDSILTSFSRLTLGSFARFCSRVGLNLHPGDGLPAQVAQGAHRWVRSRRFGARRVPASRRGWVRSRHSWARLVRAFRPGLGSFAPFWGRDVPTSLRGWVRSRGFHGLAPPCRPIECQGPVGLATARRAASHPEGSARPRCELHQSSQIRGSAGGRSGPRVDADLRGSGRRTKREPTGVKACRPRLELAQFGYRASPAAHAA